MPAAEPKAASFPLPGGVDGATVRLHPLLSGVLRWPSPWVHRQPSRLSRLRALGFGVPSEEWLECPLVSFLVEHPGAGTVLIDTGLHPTMAVDPARSIGRIAARLIRDLRMDADDAVPSQLRRRGLDPADVSVVVLTHLHFDHASGISQFPGATFVLSGTEWEAANRGNGALHGYVGGQFDHAFDYRLIDFGRPDVDSFATFGRSVDVFGDGSVRLVSTPGHTHGHLSVVLRLREREVLLTGDAAYTRLTLAQSSLPAHMEDEHLFKRSLHEIQHFAKATPDAVVIPGHDMDAWEELEEVYE